MISKSHENCYCIKNGFKIEEYIFFFSPLAVNRGPSNKDSTSFSSTSSLLGPSSSSVNLSDDTDENKYKRRSALTWLARWWKTNLAPRSRRSNKQKYLMLAFIIFFAFVTIIVLFHYFGRSGDEDDFHGDPMLDPMNNPNIRIGIH